MLTNPCFYTFILQVKSVFPTLKSDISISGAEMQIRSKFYGSVRKQRPRNLLIFQSRATVTNLKYKIFLFWGPNLGQIKHLYLMGYSDTAMRKTNIFEDKRWWSVSPILDRTDDPPETGFQYFMILLCSILRWFLHSECTANCLKNKFLPDCSETSNILFGSSHPFTN